MKRIVFLIIGALLVLGLVLPGCTPAEENIIKIAVCGPMTNIQGENHLAGAEMAADEINADGGVTINSTKYTIELVTVDTNEIIDTSGATGVIALTAVIGDVDFCVGGFQTEAVYVYREVAMEAKKIFMDCGAATDDLQFSVVTNYQRYKYWFKATPYNSTFLATSLLKMTTMIGAILKATMIGTGSPPVGAAYAVGPDDKLRVAIITEDRAWTEAMRDAAQYYLPLLGFDVVGTWLTRAATIAADMANIAALCPHIILTAFSGPVGITFSTLRDVLGIPAVPIGINVEVQSKGAWVSTGGGCNYDILLDTWAENMSITSKTVDWFNDFVAKVGDYPLYTAATYDAIYALKAAIEATDSLDSDTLVAYLETHSYTGVGATAAYYPWPAINLGGDNWALNETQVREYYDLDNYGWAYNQSEWLCGPSSMPHIAHDLLYGVGYATGIGSQWQDGHKVGIWPVQLAPLDTPIATLIAVGLIDQYGNWNFAYPGTAPIAIPIEGFLES